MTATRIIAAGPVTDWRPLTDDPGVLRARVHLRWQALAPSLAWAQWRLPCADALTLCGAFSDRDGGHLRVVEREHVRRVAPWMLGSDAAPADHADGQRDPLAAGSVGGEFMRRHVQELRAPLYALPLMHADPLQYLTMGPPVDGAHVPIAALGALRSTCERGGGEDAARVEHLRGVYARWLAGDPDVPPPIDVGVRPSGVLFLIDGNHRLVAARRAGVHAMPVRFHWSPRTGEHVDAQPPLTGVMVPVELLARVPGRYKDITPCEGDYEYIAQLADAFRRADAGQIQPLPPIQVYVTRDGDLHLHDGNHRLEAARLAGARMISVCFQPTP